MIMFSPAWVANAPALKPSSPDLRCASGIAGNRAVLRALGFCHDAPQQHAPQPEFPVPTSATAAVSGGPQALHYTSVPSTTISTEYVCHWNAEHAPRAEPIGKCAVAARPAHAGVIKVVITTEAYRGPRAIYGPSVLSRPAAGIADTS